MSSVVDTIGEEGANNTVLQLKECIYNEFKDSQVASDIYAKLCDSDMADLETLIEIDEEDMNKVCEMMELDGFNKIKFKAFIRKQKKLHQLKLPITENIITISTIEQNEINKIEDYIQKTNGLRQLFESYANDLDQNSIDLKSKIADKFTTIIQKLQQRNEAINDQVLYLSASSSYALSLALCVQGCICSDHVCLIMSIL